jgi:hypothetical protein
MATNSRTAEVLLKWRVDSASVNQVRARFNELDMEINDLRANLTGVGTSAQRGVISLRDQFARGETSVVDMQNEVEQLRRELLSLDDVKVTPTVDVQNASGGGIKDNTALNTVDRFGRFGTQISGAFGQASGLGNVVGLVGDVADSFSTLGVAGGAAALAVGGLSIVINELNRISAEAAAAEKRRLEGTIAAEQQTDLPLAARADRLKEIINLVAQGEASIAARQEEIAALEAQLYNPNFAGTQAEALALGQAIRAQIEQIRGTYDNAEGTIRNTQEAITGLTAEFRGLTESVAKDTAAIATFAPALNALGSAFGPLITNVDRTTSSITDLVTTIGGISDAVGPVITSIADNFDKLRANARAAADELRTDKAGSYLDSITQTVKAQEALTKAQTAYADAVAASEFRIAEIGRKLQDDLAQAETERQRDLADAAEKAGEDRVRVTEETEKERARIQKRFDKSYNQAVADRDALAAKRAEEQRDDELGQLDDRYKDQLKTVDKSLAQQNKVIESRYASQVATINAAAQSAVRTEQSAAQARLNALQQGVQAAQTSLVNAMQSEYLIRANYYNQAVSQAQVWANLMQLYTAYGFSIPAGAGSSGGGGGGGGVRVLPTPLADGGPAYTGRPYLVGERGPELVTFPRNAYVTPNGAAVNINVSGAQMDTIRVTSRQQALATFSTVLDRMGVA